MDGHVSKASWDIFLFGIPLIALLIFGFFRLDEVFTSRRDSVTAARRAQPKRDRQGKSMGTDPDGRPWED